MYRMVLHNKVKFPPEALAMLRLHSCYPWHTGKAYRQFMKKGDEKLEAAVIEFNKFDLYTKTEKDPPIVEEHWPYYQGIIDKYMPGKLEW